MNVAKHNPEEPVFALEETDRRTKVTRALMAVIVVALGAFAWYSAG